jgi:hypothetical protein
LKESPEVTPLDFFLKGLNLPDPPLEKLPDACGGFDMNAVAMFLALSRFSLYYAFGISYVYIKTSTRQKLPFDF